MKQCSKIRKSAILLVGGKTEINMRRVGSNFELICLKTNDRFVNVEPNQKIMLIIFRAMRGPHVL